MGELNIATDGSRRRRRGRAAGRRHRDLCRDRRPRRRHHRDRRSGQAVGAGRACRRLREDGLRIVMLTGDNLTTARAVAKTLGIDEIEAGVLPERKSEVVQRLRGEGRRVAMVGDGVNDAPALAAADVGIAMGGGTDVAIESAGVTLLTGDLMGLVRARRLSVATMRNIRQNLGFRVSLQRRRRADRRRRALSGVRHPAVADGRRRRDGAVVGQRDRQRAAAGADEAGLRRYATECVPPAASGLAQIRRLRMASSTSASACSASRASASALCARNSMAVSRSSAAAIRDCACSKASEASCSLQSTSVTI